MGMLRIKGPAVAIVLKALYCGDCGDAAAQPVTVWTLDRQHDIHKGGYSNIISTMSKVKGFKLFYSAIYSYYR